MPSTEFQRFQRINIDIVGSLPLTASSFQYNLVAGDVFFLICSSMAIEDSKSKWSFCAIYHRWFTVHCVPDALYSDQEANFKSRFFKDLLKLMRCEKTCTTSYHSSGNGGVERNNRTILSMLRFYVQEVHKCWDEALSAVVASYHTPVHESTGLSPHYPLHRRPLRLPLDLPRADSPSSRPPGTH